MQVTFLVKFLSNILRFKNTQIDEFYVSFVQYAKTDRNRFLTQRHSKAESDLWILDPSQQIQSSTFDIDWYF